MSMIDNQVHLLDLRNLFSMKSLNFYVKNVVYKINCYIHTCQWYRSFEIAHTVPQVICKITSKPKTNPICRADRDSCFANHFIFTFPSYKRRSLVLKSCPEVDVMLISNGADLNPKWWKKCKRISIAKVPCTYFQKVQNENKATNPK